jgi:hypothetical protein
LIISHSKDFIFIHLEKCGGTSIEVALEPYLSWDDIIFGSTEFGTAIQVAHIKRQEKYPNLKMHLSKHSTAHEIKKYLDKKYNKMYKFATVREPIDLMYSLYFYSKKIVNDFLSSQNIKDLVKWSVLDMPQSWIGETYLLNYVLSEIDGRKIDSFVERMIESEHPSATPQIWRIDDFINLFDISKINDRWSDILKKLNIEDDIILGRENVSLRDEKITMNKKTIELVKDHFSVDYDWIPKRTGVAWNG